MRFLKPMDLSLRFLSVFLLGTSLLLCLLFFEAPGNEAFGKVRKDFKKAIQKNDRNGDGKIGRDEWKKSPAVFDEIDADGNGYLSLDEFKIYFSDKGVKKKTERKMSSVKNKDEAGENAGESRPLWRGDANYWQGPIIDAHSQVDEKTDLSAIISLLDQAGVVRTILSTRFGQPSKDVVDLAVRHPDRIVPAAKTKTKAFMKGRDYSPADFHREVQRYHFGAMAEVIMWHAAKASVGAGKAAMDPGDPRIGPMLKTAREKGWPFIAHVEFAAMGLSKTSYMKKFEAFLVANRDVPVGMIHMGQLKAKDAARLLPEHPNLFFITSHCNPVITNTSKLPWTIMFQGDRLAPEWQELVLRFPDRFVLAFDNVFHFHWEGEFLPQVLTWRKALLELPEDVAHALAHGNAERLWKLPPAALP